MITDKQFANWAQSSTKFPVVLVEMTHSDGTVYLSNHMYFTGPSEAPANISYDVCLNQAVLVDRTLNQDSVGALRVYNDGSLDAWIDFFWEGYTIEIFIGDKTWQREDFRRQYKGNIESFSELSSTTYEVKSTIATAVSQNEIFDKNNLFVAGDLDFARAVYVTQTFDLQRFRVANAEDFDRNDVTCSYNNANQPITWIDDGFSTNTFYIDFFGNSNGQTADVNLVFISCPTNVRKFKVLFAEICAYVNQPLNADNLANYPIDPDMTWHISESMKFDDFLVLVEESIGALSWINDAGELEFYRKELPDVVGNEDRITSWITPADNPKIKTITTEYPASLVRTANMGYNFQPGSGNQIYSYNTIDPSYPVKTIYNNCFLEFSEATIESRRYADLLSVTRRTYSITINRISPELFVGAIVNIHSPKDRWESDGVGLNALVVGLTQSLNTEKSELIVWR